MSEKHELGQAGEAMAENYLQSQGFQIEHRNYRFKKAEIDLIARKGDLLVAVEVKTRSSKDWGMPQDFVKPAQIKNLVKAFDQYILSRELDVEVRFDIIAITASEKGMALEHLEDAFYHF